MAKSQNIQFVEDLTKEYNEMVKDFKNVLLEKEIANFHASIQIKVYFFENIIKAFRMESCYPDPKDSKIMNIDIYINNIDSPISVSAQHREDDSVLFKTKHNESTLHDDKIDTLIQNLVKEMVYTIAENEQIDRRSKVRNNHNTM